MKEMVWALKLFKNSNMSNNLQTCETENNNKSKFLWCWRVMYNGERMRNVWNQKLFDMRLLIHRQSAHMDSCMDILPFLEKNEESDDVMWYKHYRLMAQNSKNVDVRYKPYNNWLADFICKYIKMILKILTECHIKKYKRLIMEKYLVPSYVWFANSPLIISLIAVSVKA